MLRPCVTLLLTLAVSSIAACSTGSPKLQPIACVPELAALDRDVACAILTVPEDRADPAGPQVRLAVAVVQARAPIPGLPPVIYLQRGPGAEAIRELPRLLTRSPVSELIAVDQDWIFFDARGVGLSSPSLDCPNAPLSDGGPASDAEVDALLSCIAGHIRDGAQLSSYNTIEVARDVQDLRRALGLKRVDLFGVSAGTTTAATIQRDLPVGIRAVVQDSPWPPEAPWASATPRVVAEAVRLILAKCASQPSCDEKHPDGPATLERVVRQWSTAPPHHQGRSYRPEELGIYLMEAAYFSVDRFPADLARIAAGDLEPIDEALSARGYYHEAQHIAHLCAEEMPFERSAELTEAAGHDPVAQLLVPSLRRLFDLCEQLDVQPRPEATHPVRTSIPTLFLVAEADPGNSTGIVERAARGYQRNQTVVLPNATHATIKTACARALTRAFFRAPEQRLDRTCVEPPGAPFPFALD